MCRTNAATRIQTLATLASDREREIANRLLVDIELQYEVELSVARVNITGAVVHPASPARSATRPTAATPRNLNK